MRLINDIRLSFYVLGVSLALLITGCEDFLQPNPETFPTNETFFKSDDQFLQAVDGAYAGLQNWILQAHVLEEGRSDNTTYDNQLNRGVLQTLTRLDWFVLDTSEGEISSAWNTIYGGIKDINVPLSKIQPGIKNGNLDEALGIRLEGELKFLRAYYYFTAVRLWGNIPLMLEPLESGLKAFEISQAPQEEVFNTIIQDLEYATSNLPESYSGADVGRVTNGAAKTLLAKVYLWRENYSNAESLLRDVVNSGNYALLDNYADIFDPQNKNNAESIFEVQFQEGDKGESSNFIYQFTPVGSFPDVIPKLVGDGTWGKNLPTRELVGAYEDGDLRKETSIGFFNRTDTDSIPYVKKWAHATDPNFARTDDNWPVMRYADVLLLLAEAINEQGYETGEPFSLLNEVRDRAGLSSLTSTDLPNQEAFREALLRERRVELAFENHRWYDLIRFGVAVERMNAHGQVATQNPATPFTPVTPLNPDAYNVESFMLLYPIPENELIINPNMEQNPGY